MGRDFPDSGLMRLIRTGRVRVNKGRCRPFDRIFTGDIIRIPPYVKSSPPTSLSSGSIDVVYENQDFLSLNKPGNLPVHPGTGHKDSLVTRVVSSYQDAAFKPTPVHRLDKNTTGLILFAKSYAWLREIQDIWLSGRLEKNYLAWVFGEWKDGSGPIRDKLLRHNDKVRVSQKGKPAVSWVSPVLNRKKMTLLRISLATGRTHQIRVQLAERGFPVVGDMKYGRVSREAKRMFLHCQRISWPGRKLMVFPDWPDEYRIPEDMAWETKYRIKSFSDDQNLSSSNSKGKTSTDCQE